MNLNTGEYSISSHPTPDIVVIMLGTNDAVKDLFNAQQFHDDYVGLIKEL